jgi:Ca2+/H+ antiporter, TMEM165/GDT1 family
LPWRKRAGLAVWLGETIDCAASIGWRFGTVIGSLRLELFMEAFLISTGVVALAEIGDKTQLLAFLLAARFKKPLLIILGILIATIANHALAGILGTWMTQLMAPEALRCLLGISFILMAVWVMIPDRLDQEEAKPINGLGVFGTTLLVFFLAEIGDKTQIATVALAAQYQAFLIVVLGTTLGMMIANVPAVLIGKSMAKRIPVKLVHAIAALVFVALGVATLFGAADFLGL